MPATELMLLVPSLGTGGTERQVVLFLRGLADMRPELAARTLIVTLVASQEFARDVPAPVRMVSLGTSRVRAPLAVWRLVLLTRRERPGVVYSLLVPANLLSAVTSFVCPSQRIWGHRSQHYSMGASARTSRIVARLLRWGATRSDGIIVNSTAAAGYIESIGVRGVPIAIIPNAVDHGEFFPDPDVGLLARAELGLDGDDVMVLSVGRLAADKDHPTLLRAFADILAARPGAHLVIVGGGPRLAEGALLVLASDLGVRPRLHLLGPRSDLNRWYNGADVLVQSSSNEGSSNVLIEAEAVGCRVVSTDCGDARERLPEDHVVPVGDPEGLAAAALAALERPSAAVGPRGRGTTIELLVSSTLDFLGLGDSLRRSPEGRAATDE